MHALVYTGTQKIDYREEKDPTPKPGENIIKVQASGICGSDMHAFHGQDERRVPPLILGHEISGKALDGKLKNKNVVVNPLISCDKCEYCKNYIVDLVYLENIKEHKRIFNKQTYTTSNFEYSYVYYLKKHEKEKNSMFYHRCIHEKLYCV